MTEECAVACAAIHDELLEVSAHAARIALSTYEKCAIDAYVIRAAIRQAAAEGGIPPRIMDELTKHAQEKIRSHS